MVDDEGFVYLMNSSRVVTDPDRLDDTRVERLVEGFVICPPKDMNWEIGDLSEIRSSLLPVFQIILGRKQTSIIPRGRT